MSFGPLDLAAAGSAVEAVWCVYACTVYANVYAICLCALQFLLEG